MLNFALICERISATTKILEKQQILANYFRSLDDNTLPIAATFLCGRPFPLTEERVLNVGFALIRDAVIDIADVDEDIFMSIYREMGDSGVATERLFAGRRSQINLTFLSRISLIK